MHEFRPVRGDPRVAVLCTREREELGQGKVDGVQEGGAQLVRGEGVEDAAAGEVLLAGLAEELFGGLVGGG